MKIDKAWTCNVDCLYLEDLTFKRSTEYFCHFAWILPYLPCAHHRHISCIVAVRCFPGCSTENDTSGMPSSKTFCIAMRIACSICFTIQNYCRCVTSSPRTPDRTSNVSLPIACPRSVSTVHRHIPSWYPLICVYPR